MLFHMILQKSVVFRRHLDVPVAGPSILRGPFSSVQSEVFLGMKTGGWRVCQNVSFAGCAQGQKSQSWVG